MSALTAAILEALENGLEVTLALDEQRRHVVARVARVDGDVVLSQSVRWVRDDPFPEKYVRDVTRCLSRPTSRSSA